MNELVEITKNLIIMNYENNLYSEIKGNRNWCIRTEHYITSDGQEIKTAYVGRYGALKRRGLLSEFIRNIGKYHIRWYNFTYKKDFEKNITQLAENEFYIKWLG